MNLPDVVQRDLGGLVTVEAYQAKVGEEVAGAWRVWEDRTSAPQQPLPGQLNFH